eukprot:jgi/Galph1/3808/GphlegSOOS_G2494.1
MGESQRQNEMRSSSFAGSDVALGASELLPTNFQVHRRVASMSLEPLQSSSIRLPSRNSAFRSYQHPFADLESSSRSESEATTSSSSANSGLGDWNRSQSPPRLLLRVTVVLLDTYHRACSEFRYNFSNRPRRCLTNLNRGVYNFGFDNRENELIIYVNDILETPSDERYIVVDLFGGGTFGQVFKCFNEQTGEVVAVKVIKNQPAYYRQAWMEVYILDVLHKTHLPEKVKHIVKLLRYFVYRNHLCLVFESLNINLYELIKLNNFRGLGLELVSIFVEQILQTLVVLSDSSIIHCDLKPENILLTKRGSTDLKIIDFGSSCQENHVVYTYVQSRFYRSIEVLLGASYNSAIDMWSLGCIAGELFLGLPLFPGSSVFNMVCRIVEMLDAPPDHLIERSRGQHRFFNVRRDFIAGLGGRKYQLKSVEQYERETSEHVVWKRYFQQKKLKDIIMGYPIWRTNPASQREVDLRLSFVDFLHGLLQVDPDERWTPLDALQHPFIKLEPLPSNEPWTPPERLERRKLLGHRARMSSFSSTSVAQSNLKEYEITQEEDGNMEPSRTSISNRMSEGDSLSNVQKASESSNFRDAKREEIGQVSGDEKEDINWHSAEEEWVAGKFVDEQDLESFEETASSSAVDDEMKSDSKDSDLVHATEEVIIRQPTDIDGNFERSMDSLQISMELSERAPPPPPTAPFLNSELGTSAPAGSGLPASPFSVAWVRGTRSSSVVPGETRASKWLRARRYFAVSGSDTFSNQMTSKDS